MMTPRGGDGLGIATLPPPKSKKDGADERSATLYDREEYLASLEAKAFYFIPGPYRWTRYVLYPEKLFVLTNKWLSKSFHNLWQTDMPSSQDACPEQAGGTCAPEWTRKTYDALGSMEEQEEHMAIAAQYYRKAAEEHNSARANFNLGFMHEWGMGLSQDFPLAKRHYDLAAKDNANKAAAIALYAMNIHQKAVQFAMMYLGQRGVGNSEVGGVK
jgi:TPR repeat protein